MRIPTSIVLVALLCLPVRAALAQVVYKCVGKGGAVSFQSDPCSATHKTVKAVYAPPERDRARPVSGYATTTRSQAQVNNYVYESPAVETERDRRKRDCELAKRSRQSTLDQIGLQRTYDLLRKLDAAVYDACQGL